MNHSKEGAPLRSAFQAKIVCGLSVTKSLEELNLCGSLGCRRQHAHFFLHSDRWRDQRDRLQGLRRHQRGGVHTQGTFHHESSLSRTESERRCFDRHRSRPLCDAAVLSPGSSGPSHQRSRGNELCRHWEDHQHAGRKGPFHNPLFLLFIFFPVLIVGHHIYLLVNLYLSALLTCVFVLFCILCPGP